MPTWPADRELWEKIARKLHDWRNAARGRRAARSRCTAPTLTTWIDGELAQVGLRRRPRDPGRVTIRRLNRNEYNNTIRDLLGVDFQPADDFPSDDVGYGFDNIGDVLSMPPILLEKYLAAAENITARVLGTEQANLVTNEITGGQLLDDGARIVTSEADRSPHQVAHVRQRRVPVPRPGLGRSGRRRAGADGRLSRQEIWSALRRQSRRATSPRSTKAGSTRKAAGALSRSCSRTTSTRPDRSRPHDRNLYFDDIEADGPLSAERSSGSFSQESHARERACRCPRNHARRDVAGLSPAGRGRRKSIA